MRPLCAALVLATCALAQPPRFGPRDVRPQGAADPHPLLPGMSVWIFGENLGPHCGVANMMDPATYKTELCGVRVLFGGVEARLLYTSPTQLNLIAPDHPWENEMVNVQVIRDTGTSAVVPVRFGVNRPVLSLPEPAFTGMPVWLRVEMPWGKGWLRYPHSTEPWEVASGKFEVRFEGRDLAILQSLPYAPFGWGMMVGLPREVPRERLGRAPLHLVYAFDRPGTYEVRYTETRDAPGGRRTLYQQSHWTKIEIRPSTPDQRRAWLLKRIAAPPSDPVDLLSDYLPSLLACHDEPALRVLSRYLDAPDEVLRQYAALALNYFDPALLARVVPGRKPPYGFVVH